MRKAAVFLLLFVGGCGPTKFPEPPPRIDLREPAADSVESVLYLVGDAGDAYMEHSPILYRLQNEIEEWSGNVGRTGAVTVLYLGDNVYPRGLRDRTDPGYFQDSDGHLWEVAWNPEWRIEE